MRVMDVTQIGRWIFAFVVSLVFHGLVLFAVSGGCTSGPKAEGDGQEKVAEPTDEPKSDAVQTPRTDAPAAAANAASPTSSVDKTPSSADDWTDYKVRSGDTLSGLAKRFGVTVRELAERNGTDAKTLAQLRIGQVIRVPAGDSAAAAADPAK